MSQPIPVDILSDSDSDSGGDRRKNLRSEAIDLTTPPPFPQSKKKQRTEAISNPSGSTVFIIDDDPTPCKKTSDSTPSFVAETPFSDASLVGCSTRKYSVSGESLATEQLVVADTPMTERLNAEVSLVKCDTRVLNRDYASLMSNNSSAVADTPMTVRLNTEVSLTKRDARLLNSDYASLMSNHGSAGESSASEQLVVEDTPMTESLKAEVSLTERDTRALNSDYASLMSNHNSAETYGLICVDSDNESENVGVFEAPRLDGIFFGATPSDELEFDSRLVESSFSLGPSVPLQKKLMHNPVTVHRLEGCSSPDVLEDDIYVACDDTEDKASEIDPMAQMGSQQSNSGCFMKEKKKAAETMKPKRTSKEERLRLMEEKKKLKEQEKLLKAAAKAEAAELKKFKKEMQKWEKGKYALKSIVAEIDKKVVELGSIGGHLLTRFAEKGLSYRITSNPVERSIVWNMVVPEEISVVASDRIEISYVLIICEAEEFCHLVMNESLTNHIRSVQHQYPHHTICYATNRLMAYINKREKAQYKNPANYSGWKRPAMEEALTKLATHYFRVHSRQCVDEAELAEHVVGLTCSLASCQFRKKLTRLSVNANGSIIPKDCTEKNLIKNNLWLKALVSIPKVQPRFAIAIWKKYPTMKSLLRIYMDPIKSVHEKEFLLKDLTTEGLFGDDRRLGEVCSKRIYRILMAQSGNIKTDDVENGADFFSRHST